MPSIESKNCPQCGAPIDPMSTNCKYCGAEITIQTPQQVPQYQVQQSQQNIQPQYIQPQDVPVYQTSKNKTTAGILALLLGGLGIHKFYLGRIGWGIIYILFCWTYIPAFVGLIEGIIYLTSSDEKFYYKYVKK